MLATTLATAAVCLIGAPLRIRIAALGAAAFALVFLFSKLREANRRLEGAREDAEDAARARQETLAVVAHDLRNPLNAMSMTARLFTEIDPPVEDRRRLAATMQRSAGRMNRMIEDLLDVARIDAGRFTVEPEDTPVVAIVSQTLEMFEHTAREKGISLIAEPAKRLWARADEQRAIQALANLVGNAMKFVPAGGSVIIRCSGDENAVLIAVIDSGPGIAPEQLGRLFERFWQARRSDRRGMGLGLSIARGIIEAHGGRIWAESVPGRGSTFWFSLPASPRGRRAATYASNGPKAPRVLESVA